MTYRATYRTTDRATQRATQRRVPCARALVGAQLVLALSAAAWAQEGAEEPSPRAQGRVVVTVVGEAPMPARLSVSTPDGEAVTVRPADAGAVTRKGLLYTRAAGSAFDLPAGDYVLSATRGMEWSAATQPLKVVAGETHEQVLRLVREVDTRGYVAADTHVHTRTFSGHGDATLDERILTLAGEGVELAVATDHNHHTDYRPAQARLKLSSQFTPVTGNEVTTRNGHFNGFPMDPKGPLPSWKERDWVKLVAGIRARGAKVVILNHPHWPKRAKGPFGVFDLDPATGDRSAAPFTFDAMELVNTHVKEPEPLTLFEDWFALLDRGERIAAVGSSDSHTVADPVGGGRTYVRSSSDDPAAIDVDEACEAFLRADVSVAMGIFVTIAAGEAGAGMGQTLKAGAGAIPVQLRVASPGWVRPRTALLFVNGERVAERALTPQAGKPTDVTLRFDLARPAVDGHLVAVVLGAAVSVPGWKSPNAYTLGATNPVYVDCDGTDGYASPRETARARLANLTLDALPAALKAAPRAVAAQMLSLARERLEQVGAQVMGAHRH